jgi:hypothetical protein
MIKFYSRIFLDALIPIVGARAMPIPHILEAIKRSGSYQYNKGSLLPLFENAIIPAHLF